MIFGKKKDNETEENQPKKEELTDSERIEQGQILIRAIIEVLGKPEKHVKETIEKIVEQLKKASEFSVEKADISESKEVETMFSVFAEVELWIKNIDLMMGFLMDYMPSSVEVMSPETLSLHASNVNGFINDVIAKLHNLDMHVKNFKQQNTVLSNNVTNLMRNIITIALGSGEKSIEDLSRIIGIKETELPRILSVLEKEKLVSLDKNRVSLNSELIKIKKSDNNSKKNEKKDKKDDVSEKKDVSDKKKETHTKKA